jgi:hypothetical protein
MREPVTTISVRPSGSALVLGASAASPRPAPIKANVETK